MQLRRSDPRSSSSLGTRCGTAQRASTAPAALSVLFEGLSKGCTWTNVYSVVVKMPHRHPCRNDCYSRSKAMAPSIAQGWPRTTSYLPSWAPATEDTAIPQRCGGRGKPLATRTGVRWRVPTGLYGLCRRGPLGPRLLTPHETEDTAVIIRFTVGLLYRIYRILEASPGLPNQELIIEGSDTPPRCRWAIRASRLQSRCRGQARRVWDQAVQTATQVRCLHPRAVLRHKYGQRSPMCSFCGEFAAVPPSIPCHKHGHDPSVVGANGVAGCWAVGHDPWVWLATALISQSDHP